MPKWFWWKPVLFNLGQIVLFFISLSLEQFLGPLVFSLGLYLFFVGPVIRTFNFVFLTLICAWLISFFTLIPWWSVTLILFLSVILTIGLKKLLKSFRLSLVIVAILSALVLSIISKLPLTPILLLKILLSCGCLSAVFLARKPISFSGYNWHLD